MTFLKLIIHHLNNLNCLKYFIFNQIHIMYFSKCFDLNECHICEVMCHCLRLPLKIHCTIGSTLCFCYVIRKQTWYHRKIFFFLCSRKFNDKFSKRYICQTTTFRLYPSFKWIWLISLSLYTCMYCLNNQNTISVVNHNLWSTILKTWFKFHCIITFCNVTIFFGD